MIAVCDIQHDVYALCEVLLRPV